MNTILSLNIFDEKQLNDAKQNKINDTKQREEKLHEMNQHNLLITC